MNKEDLKQYLIDEAEYTEEEVESLDSYELFNAWLEWNGIWGYTDGILEVVKASGITKTDFYKSL